MPRPKKFTQFIFDDVRDPRKKELYAELGLMYEMFEAFVVKRYRLKLTQEELAQKIGIKQEALARIEAGRANPSIHMVLRIARALNLKVKVV